VVGTRVCRLCFKSNVVEIEPRLVNNVIWMFRAENSRFCSPLAEWITIKQRENGKRIRKVKRGGENKIDRLKILRREKGMIEDEDQREMTGYKIYSRMQRPISEASSQREPIVRSGEGEGLLEQWLLQLPAMKPLKRNLRQLVDPQEEGRKRYEF